MRGGTGEGEGLGRGRRPVPADSQQPPAPPRPRVAAACSCASRGTKPAARSGAGPGERWGSGSAAPALGLAGGTPWRTDVPNKRRCDSRHGCCRLLLGDQAGRGGGAVTAPPLGKITPTEAPTQSLSSWPRSDSGQFEGERGKGALPENRCSRSFIEVQQRHAWVEQRVVAPDAPPSEAWDKYRSQRRCREAHGTGPPPKARVHTVNQETSHTFTIPRARRPSPALDPSPLGHTAL